MVDLAAARLGIDPLELRRRNVVTEFPSVMSQPLSATPVQFGARLKM